MDLNIVRPPTMWIEDRCYRVLCSPDDCSNINFEEEDYYNECIDESEDRDLTANESLNIEELENGKFKLLLSIPSVYFPYLIGSKGATKLRIENDTHSKIVFPYKGMQGDITITGRNRKYVRQAGIKINILVDQAKRRQPFTHFISVPMDDPSIENGFLAFKDKVLDICGDARGVDGTIFQDPKKLHLTLGVAVLSDSRERKDAIEQFISLQNDIYTKFSNNFPYRVEVRGIEYMNDDPGEIDVLYGKIVAASFSTNIEELCQYISKKLEDAGVLLKQHENLKLHMTLMNTLFRKNADETAKKQRDTFNGRSILEEFHDYYFGEMEINEVHLSVRYSTSSNGYYKSSQIISMILDE